MRALIFAASVPAILLAGAATLSGCQSGQGQASLSGGSMDWRRANAVPAGMVGQIIGEKNPVKQSRGRR